MVPIVTSVGEVLVDFVSMKSGAGLRDSPAFKKCAGGAAANLAVGVAKLGIPSAFVGNVGDDSFGRFLQLELKKFRVDTSGLRLDPDFKTRLAFVALKNNGDREFEFWEQHPADEQLLVKNIDIKKLFRSRIVHLGSFSLVHEPARTTMLTLAKNLYRRCIVSFDPNLRLSLWSSKNDALRLTNRMVRFSTILRLNRDEAKFLTGRSSFESAAQTLRASGPKLVVITDGAKGSYAQTASASAYAHGFNVKALDTTACGDTFLAALLRGVITVKTAIDKMTERQLTSMLVYANAAGALKATRHGVIDVMPTHAEVKKFLHSTLHTK